MDTMEQLINFMKKLGGSFKLNDNVIPNVKKPIFIVGCGRSGTTLLFNLLSQHPQVAKTTGYPDGEDHEGWIKHGQCVMAGIGNATHKNYQSGITGNFFCLHMDDDDASSDIIANMHSYYWNEVLHRHDGRRVLNKQPHLSNKLKYLLKIFPDAKIIHVIRQCEPTVASWLAVMREHPTVIAYWPFHEKLPCLWLFPKPETSSTLRCIGRNGAFYPGGGEELFIDYWNKINQGIVQQMDNNQSQLLTVRYEDVILNTQETLQRISDFSELKTFEFAADSVLRDTAKRHSKLITPELKKAIFERTKTTNEQFGYQHLIMGE